MDSRGEWQVPDADTLACIRRTVEAWPPLTAEQCDRIALLLRPDPGEARPGGGVGRLDPGTLEPSHPGGRAREPYGDPATSHRVP